MKDSDWKHHIGLRKIQKNNLVILNQLMMSKIIIRIAELNKSLLKDQKELNSSLIKQLKANLGVPKKNEAKVQPMLY